MIIRFYNARVLTLERDTSIFTGELWTKDDSILYVGEQPFKGEKPDREIDCKENLLLPGFKNAHTHSGMTFLRSYADDLPLQEWLFNKVFPLENKLTPDDVYTLSKLAILEYVSGGITANFDMYFFMDQIAQASIDSGFRTVLCGAINDFGGTVERLENEYKTFNNRHPLISYQLGFHAEYTTSLPLLKQISELAHQLKTPVYTHNAETKAEVEGCIQRHHTTPTILLDSLGMFEYGGGGFHCVYLSEEDRKIFSQKRLWAITNPGSNSKLASGIAPIVTMMEEGIPLAIGTDGPASNNCLDMFKEMFLVTSLQKLQHMDASACPAENVLLMACKNGAYAMGLSNSDCLSVGKKADLILIDLQQPNMQPIHNIPKNLVYSGSKQNVVLTMVDGKILFEKGEFFLDEPAHIIYEKTDKIVRRILSEA